MENINDILGKLRNGGNPNIPEPPKAHGGGIILPTRTPSFEDRLLALEAKLDALGTGLKQLSDAIQKICDIGNQECNRVNNLYEQFITFLKAYQETHE